MDNIGPVVVLEEAFHGKYIINDFYRPISTALVKKFEEVAQYMRDKGIGQYEYIYHIATAPAPVRVRAMVKTLEGKEDADEGQSG